MTTEQLIDNFIKENSEENLAVFHKKLIDTKFKINGIRTTTLRNFAKILSKENCKIEDIKPLSHEHILLKGMILGNKKLSDKEIIAEFNKFIDYIDNWATCDMIVGCLKRLKTENGYNFFTCLLSSQNPFKIRVGIVGLMSNFLETDKKDEIINNLLKVTNENYYVKMAIAWLLCTLTCKDFKYGRNAIQKFNDKFVRNKAISKCQDSFRLSAENKTELKKLRI